MMGHTETPSRADAFLADRLRVMESNRQMDAATIQGLRREVADWKGAFEAGMRNLEARDVEMGRLNGEIARLNDAVVHKDGVIAMLEGSLQAQAEVFDARLKRMTTSLGQTLDDAQYGSPS